MRKSPGEEERSLAWQGRRLYVSPRTSCPPQSGPSGTFRSDVLTPFSSCHSAQRLKFRLNLYELKEGRQIKPYTLMSMVANLLYEKR